MPRKSACALAGSVAASVASGEPGPNTVSMSRPVFSNSMLATENAPTSQPARVKATHGAGAILPSLPIIRDVVSVIGRPENAASGSVQ